MNRLGQFFCMIQACLPQHLLTQVAGRIAESEIKAVKNLLIFAFIKVFKVDLTDAQVENYRHYKHFNDFFTRQLKSDARPVSEGKTLCSPVDGKVSQAGQIQKGRLIQAKGKDFRLAALIADNDQWAAEFKQGHFVTIYLSPKDYHRIHMPYDGTLLETRYVPGQLFSVNQSTTHQVSNLFTRNERLVCFFQSEFGPFAMVYVGAMVVGNIQTPWEKQYLANPFQILANPEPQGPGQEKLSFKKGEEVGLFKLGSTVILITPEKLKPEDHCTPDVTVRMGQSISSF